MVLPLPPFAARYRLVQCSLDILIFTDTRVDNLPGGVQHGDIGGGWSLKRAYSGAIPIPQEREWPWGFLGMPTHGVLALIHRDRDDEKLRAITVLVLCRFHPGQQLGANRTPRRPEFHDDRLLADPLR